MVANALRGFLVLGLLVLLAHVVLVRVTVDPFAVAAAVAALPAPAPSPCAAPPCAAPLASAKEDADFDIDSPDLDSFFKSRITDCASQSVAQRGVGVADEPCRPGPATLGAPIVRGEADGSGVLNGGDYMDGIAPFDAFGGGLSAF